MRLRDNLGTTNISGNQPNTFSQSILSCGKSLQRVIHRIYPNFAFAQQGPSILNTPDDPRSDPQDDTDPPTVKYVLVCINTQKNRSRLQQIPVYADAKDGRIFTQIRTRYFEVRGWRSVLILRTVERLRIVKVHILLFCS